jgi:hypothetical protein
MLSEQRIRGVAGQDSVPSSEQSELASSDDLESDATGSDAADLICKEDMFNKLAKPEVDSVFVFGVSFASRSDLPEAVADTSSRLIMEGDLAPLGGTDVVAVLFSACNADSNTRIRSSCRSLSNSRFRILSCAVASSRSISQTPST